MYQREDTMSCQYLGGTLQELKIFHNHFLTFSYMLSSFVRAIEVSNATLLINALMTIFN
jgi:hypothetical protein